MRFFSVPSLAVALVCAAHVIFRLGYLYYIGVTMKAARFNAKRDEGERYEDWLRFKKRANVVFAGDVATFIFLVLFTADTFPPEVPFVVTFIGGAILTGIGLAVKSAASWTIGEKGFYCYNFFCADEEREYVAKGVYRYLNNPMYGPGYFQIIGLPLMFRSGWGIAFGLFDWAVIWLFYFMFERQHTRVNRHGELVVGHRSSRAEGPVRVTR